MSLGKLEVAGRLDRFLTEQFAANGFETLHVEMDHVALPGDQQDGVSESLAMRAHRQPASQRLPGPLRDERTSPSCS